MNHFSQDQYIGALLGCAVGDALGAPFEGLWAATIPSQEELISGFAEFEGYPRGQYTDDTQLTIATVEAILERRELDPALVAKHIGALWRDATVIGPGGACMQAGDAYLRDGDWTSCGAPVGQAGNGTAMRTAILGLCFPESFDDLPRVVAQISRITHHDSRSVAGGVAAAVAAQVLATNSNCECDELCARVAGAMEPYDAAFADLVESLPRILAEPREAALSSIAWAGMTEPEFGDPIITPFVVPTVMASLCAVITHPHSWADAVASVIRLGGDVDTLGAIVGSIMGAKLGADALPSNLREEVVDSSRLESLGAQLHALFDQKSWPGGIR